MLLSALCIDDDRNTFVLPLEKSFLGTCFLLLRGSCLWMTSLLPLTSLGRVQRPALGVFEARQSLIKQIQDFQRMYSR
jgi:hypothetical protein